MLKLKNNRKKRNNERADLELKKYNLNKINYLPGSMVGKILILCFIAMDFIFITQLVDAYFTQSVLMVLAASAVIACLIDISPSILAGCMSVTNKKPIHYVGMILTLLALVSGFAVLALIRLNSADLIYQTADNQITSLVSTQEKVQSVGEQGYLWMSVLFCIIPVFTSIVGFMIGLFENSGNKEEYLDKVNLIMSKEELFDLEANNLELEFELQRDLDSINDSYRDLEISDTECRKAIAKELVKLKMAQAVGTPQALSNFMENAAE